MGSSTGSEASLLPLLAVRMVMLARLGRASSSGSGFCSIWQRSRTILVRPVACVCVCVLKCKCKCIVLWWG